MILNAYYLRKLRLVPIIPLALLGCDQRPLGSNLDEGAFGNPTMTYTLYQTGELNFTQELAERFAREVPTMINFEFNSAVLDQRARTILREQAAFILAFPEVRFTVYGHTDLVGSDAHNQRLGERRARAAVDYLADQGIERSRLDALVSLGETQPIVATENRERRNRRTVTEVTGFIEAHPMVLDGNYARIVFRSYAGSGSD